MDKAAKKQRIKRTDEEKLDLIHQWKKSGLPIAAFCRQHHFSDSLFHSWLKEYRRNTATPQVNDFVPLQITEAVPSMPDDQAFSLPEKVLPFAELVMASGGSIKLYQPVGADYLRTLIS
ncbi:transposase [Paraflavisolibacter sp. H34]|uniref:IS66 family insertion sequence element accessory protein TnpA n=1 Tax=Huijunlia imazamoxiresistens TaxID=3127457 RepID=UPI00301AB7D7